jgi:hypothetical protein
MTDVASFAVAIAPHIDRTVVAVHPAARPGAMVVLRAVGLTGGGVLVPLLTPLLSGPVAVSALHSVVRYERYEWLVDGLDEHVRQGLLTRTNGTVTATPTGRDVLLGLRRAQGLAITELWRDQALASLLLLARRVVATATGGPAFTLMTPTAPVESPAHDLHDQLTVLRYHRADAHAAAWADAGLTAESVQRLEPGPLADRIESATNRRAAQPYETLDPTERIALLKGLEQL